MFHVVISDLDGTLLTPECQLTYFTKKFLNLLTDLQVHFIFATGRNYVNVVPIRNQLGIYDYMITSNGARIYDASDKLIDSCDLNLDIVYDLLIMVSSDPAIVTNIFQEHHEWSINQYFINTSCSLNSYDLMHRLNNIGILSESGINKIFFVSKNIQKLLLLEKKINARWGSGVNVSFSSLTCLEVMPGGVSKGSAIEKVAHLLGYQLKDCISFGDGMNDQEMLSMTGKGCIMCNAHQRLKDMLPYLEIIGSNKYESVPYYLNSIFF